MKRGSNAASFMYADTGVSRSPAMSNSACNAKGSSYTRQQKTHHRGRPEMGCWYGEFFKVAKNSWPSAHSVIGDATTKNAQCCRVGATYVKEYHRETLATSSDRAVFCQFTAAARKIPVNNDLQGQAKGVDMRSSLT